MDNEQGCFGPGIFILIQPGHFSDALQPGQIVEYIFCGRLAVLFNCFVDLHG